MTPSPSRVPDHPAAAAPPPGGSPLDPADAAMRAELAAPTGPGTGWRPWHGDPLAEGLYAGHHDAPRQRRLAAFAADPEAHLRGWRLAAAIRACGADVALTAGGLILPRGFAALPPFLAAEARRERDGLARWLRLEHDAPAALRQHARPPYGAAEALREGRDWCIACGPPPPGAVATWWAVGREWSCATCCPPPDDDDRVTFGYGCSGDDPAPAGCAPGAGGPDRAHGDLT